jgi:alkylation response protein AidB-like acyl-CoA dehydrogenase
VFFEDVRAPRENLVGHIGEGWRIAMTVLAYERGAVALAYSAKYGRDLAQLAAACREIGRTDRACREKLGRLLVENEVMRANGIRVLANLADGRAPGPESSLEKLYWSDFDKRFRETALDLLGPGGQLLRESRFARSEVDWAREFLWSRAGTIYSGSSECSATSSPSACSSCRRTADEVRAVRGPGAAPALRRGSSSLPSLRWSGTGSDGGRWPGLRRPRLGAARRDGLRGPHRATGARRPGLGAVELGVVLEEVGRHGVPGPLFDAMLAATLLAAAPDTTRCSPICSPDEGWSPSLGTTDSTRASRRSARRLPADACAAPSTSCRSALRPTRSSSRRPATSPWWRSRSRRRRCRPSTRRSASRA